MMYTNFCPMRKRKCSCTPLSPLKGVGDSSAYGWLKQLFLRVFSSPFRGAGGVFWQCSFLAVRATLPAVAMS